jgi:putative peptidoglycan lipid II flippase
MRTTLVRAAVITVAVTMAGSLLGLFRDVFLARWFGADGGTDAFLVAWTVPETAFSLVVEGAMSLLMIPLFSRALSQARARDAARATRRIVAATLPRVLVVLVATSAAAIVGAPVLVRVLAPGLADPDLAVTCTRLTSITVLTFGLTGYLSAALRANHVFGAPAAIHLAYNVGILGLMWTLHGRLGVISAAAGVALGSVLMVLVQLPSYLRHVGVPRRWRFTGSAVTLAAVAPIVVYTLTRQAQVFVERFLGSSLPPGTISYLNYAQKVTQIPVMAAVLVCTATFPTLARHMAAGDVKTARRRVETDLRTVTALVLVAAAYLVAFAPEIVGVLFEHGRFTAADTTATAAIMRVAALGMFGHAMVGVLARPFFTGEERTWYPAVAMGIGLAVTAVLAAAGLRLFDAYAIVAANGIGITVTAVLLLSGLRVRIVAISVPAVCGAAVRLAAAAAAAGLLGWLAGRAMTGWPPALIGTIGGLVVLAAFAALSRLAGFDEVTVLASQLKRRIRHGS